MHDTHQGGRRREVTRLAAVLGHADAALDTLLPRGREQVAGPDFFTRTKLATETAMVLYAVSRADAGLDDTVARIATRLREPARSPELLAWARLRPPLIPELSVAHFVLTALGDPDPATDEALALAASACSVAPIEQLPWKRLERAWHAELGAPPGGHPVRVDLEATALGQRQDALFATREEAYGLTHALIYHTDFGHRMPAMPRPTAEVVADAGSALARCLDDDDFDLGAEVLFTWPYTRTPWTPVAAFGLHVLRAVDEEVGYLPSMTLRTDEFARLPEQERADYFFKEAYHTVYVMGLLTAATLAPGVDTGPALAERLEGAHWAARLRALVPAAACRPWWETEYDRLTPGQQGALVPFLADVAVRRAVRAGEFGRLPAILSTALGGLADLAVDPTPAVEQGVELLNRLADAAGERMPTPGAAPMPTPGLASGARPTQNVAVST